ncbi:amidohydrolase [Brenneria sp. 4F2]|nr:amidohydrolase [Brenneria bubanii]
MSENNLQSQLSEWRRLFHQTPEMGWSEFITSATLIAALRDLGYQVLPGAAFLSPGHLLGRDESVVADGLARARKYGVAPALLEEMNALTGCAALLDTGLPGPTIALRFDIDCVAVDETQEPSHLPRQKGFVSQFPGCMHACGHDGHMAMGLGVADWLMRHRDRLRGKFKLVFQPAEEGVRGARPVAEGGILDDADYFLSAHLGMGAASNEIIADPQDFLCTTKADFRFYGAPAHAGVAPHGGANALAGACHCVTQLLGIARHGEGVSRINIGTLRAGEGRNVISAFAEMQLEVRGENQQINQYMLERAQRIAEGIAWSFNLRFEHQVVGEATDLRNDAELVALVGDIARQQLGMKLCEGRFGGSEDATLLARRVQANGGKAIYFVLGADRAAGHHEADFDFDESALSQGVRLFCASLAALASL